MITTKFEYLNRTLAIIDSCQTVCKIHFAFNLPTEFYDLTVPTNSKGLSIQKYLDANFNFLLTQSNKAELLNDIAENYEEQEICHYTFYKDEIKIAEGYDHCELNFLHSEYFKLTKQHMDILKDVDVHFKISID